jgi:hypothetical protein
MLGKHALMGESPQSQPCQAGIEAYPRKLPFIGPPVSEPNIRTSAEGSYSTPGFFTTAQSYTHEPEMHFGSLS